MGVSVDTPGPDPAAVDAMEGVESAEKTDIGEFRAFWEDFISARDETHEHIAHDTSASQGETVTKEPETLSTEIDEGLLATVREAVIGHAGSVSTPYGTKTIVYGDYTASGRALAPIEDYIRKEVLPVYANTHTTTSHTGLQTTCYRLEARQMVAESVNARVTYKDVHSDVVLFTGSGTTAAINKLVQILGLHIPPADEVKRCVVLVGPHEHHSNILPWREAPGCEVVAVPEDRNGALDRVELQRLLQQYQDRDLRIGAFSAASNVTGVVADVDGITQQLHKAGALSFWDYAAAAPHLAIDMNPAGGPEMAKDAVYFSPHKLVGGPGAPGVLVVKRRLLNIAKVPTQPGGGTVFFVTNKSHTYLKNAEEREESGTPDILGSLRAGLAIQVKSRLGARLIQAAEERLVSRVMSALTAIPNVTVLGPPDSMQQRLAIFSFVVHTPWAKEQLLHHSFVCAVLNDVYGIQTRGGCVCAGPYGLQLLGVSPENAARFEDELKRGRNEPMRPGFVRLSLPFFASPAEVDYCVEAIRQVAEKGWLLLPEYMFSMRTGEWRHESRLTRFPERQWLSNMAFPHQEPANVPGTSCKEDMPRQADAKEYEETLRRQLQEAAAVFAKAEAAPQPTDSKVLEDPFAHDLRWFALPRDAAQYKRVGRVDQINTSSPVRPIRYPRDDVINDYEDSGIDESTGAACSITCLPCVGPVEPKKPPPKLMRLYGEAIRDFDMIQPGDRLLLGLSGGKDSLALLHCLLETQKRSPVKFELACATVNPGIEQSFNPRPLIKYMEKLGVPYYFLDSTIFEDAANSMRGDSICAFCSRMKRGVLYSCCRAKGFNKLVLGQHLDDMAESFFMSAFRNGQIRTMKASYMNDAGDIAIIRPLCYVRESMTREFSYSAGLPIINENCPACFEAPKERARVKKMLAREEAENPSLFSCLKRSLTPLMHPEAQEALLETAVRIDAKKRSDRDRSARTRKVLGDVGLRRPERFQKNHEAEQAEDSEQPRVSEADAKPPAEQVEASAVDNDPTGVHVVTAKQLFSESHAVRSNRPAAAACAVVPEMQKVAALEAKLHDKEREIAELKAKLAALGVALL